jgi:hypothetical protein
MTALDRDERDITSTSYTMSLIELGYRVTQALIWENVDSKEES